MSEKQKPSALSGLVKKVNVGLSLLQNKDNMESAATVAKNAQEVLNQAQALFYQGKAAIDAHHARQNKGLLGRIFAVPAQVEKGVFKQSLIVEFPFGSKTMSLLADSATVSGVDAEGKVTAEFATTEYDVTRTYSAAIDESNVLGKNGFQLNLYCQLLEKGGKNPCRVLEISGGLYNMNAKNPEELEHFHSVVQITDSHAFQEHDTGKKKILLPRQMTRRFGVDGDNRLVLLVEIL